MAGTPQENQPIQPTPSSPPPNDGSSPSQPIQPPPPPPNDGSSPSQPIQPPPPSTEEEAKKWGTQVMGPPAVPASHPDNQTAASWNAQQYHHPYLVYTPIDRPPTNNPLEPVINVFHSWSTQAESIARNLWHNLNTGSSVTGAAWGKVNLTAKAMTEGGFESLYHQNFQPEPNDKLKKTFACYLSTTTGPVAGTIYLSTTRVAFCSDRPLSFAAPSGQPTWSYYKVVIPLWSIETVNPVIMQHNSEKYIQISTVDGHDFWFMGFVSFEKASHHLLDSLSDFRAHEVAPRPVGT